MVRVLRPRWRMFKYIKKKPSREGDIRRGIDIFFRVQGIIVVSVDKAASSSHMDAENAINLGKKNERALEGASNFDCLRDTTTTHRNRSLRSASLIPPLPPPPRYPTVPRGRTDTGCPSHDQNQYSEAPSTHPRPPQRALALPRLPSSACQEGKETARTSQVKVAARRLPGALRKNRPFHFHLAFGPGFPG